MSTIYRGTAGDYTIKGGDNLSTIAKNVGVTVSDLAKWNSISDVNKIGAGAKLYTKDPKTATAVAASASTPAVAPTPEGNVVTTINGVKTINENDIYKTGASFESTVPTSTDAMKEDGLAYSWEKEGAIQGFLETQVQTEQVKREALEAKSKLNAAAINDANGREETIGNQNQNKMGISGRAQADMDRSIVVARNARTLDLYSQDEMIKNGYETGVKIAAMYGDLKEREVTASEYDKAVGLANSRAEITGVFFEPVQMQLLGQFNTAESILANPNATAEEKTRATNIVTGVSDAFIELGITNKGIKTITAIYQEQSLAESERANDIAESSNGIQSRAIQEGVNQSVLNQVEIQLGKGKKFTNESLQALITSIGGNQTVAEIKAIYDIE